jgi:hypothetical protein
MRTVNPRWVPKGWPAHKERSSSSRMTGSAGKSLGGKIVMASNQVSQAVTLEPIVLANRMVGHSAKHACQMWYWSNPTQGQTSFIATKMTSGIQTSSTAMPGVLRKVPDEAFAKPRPVLRPASSLRSASAIRRRGTATSQISLLNSELARLDTSRRMPNVQNIVLKSKHRHNRSRLRWREEECLVWVSTVRRMES